MPQISGILGIAAIVVHFDNAKLKKKLQSQFIIKQENNQLQFDPQKKKLLNSQFRNLQFNSVHFN